MLAPSMHLEFAPEEIAAIVRPRESRGSTADRVTGIASLSDAQPGDLSFLGGAKYRADVASTRASVVLVPTDYPGDPRPNQLFLAVEQPSLALARVCGRIERALWPTPAPGIHPTAWIAPGARVDPTATVGPLCVVEDGAEIGARTHLQAQVFVGRASRVGEDCWLRPGVVVAAECSLRNRVHLHPGVVVGSDGFGYEFSGGRHEKIPQVGTVVIEDDVEIGANTTLDRARFSQTRVGEGTKIDNLVQVGHNVVIGRHCLICGQAGISGSATLEDYVVLAGQAGLAGHLRIGKGAKVGPQAGVSRDVPAKASVYGTPALPYILEQKLHVLKQRLPELFERVGELEKRIGEPASGG